MKFLFYTLFAFSIGLNAYFLTRRIIYIKKFNAYNQLFRIKDITHKDGFACYQEKLKNDPIEGKGALHKINLVYFWDSLNFDFRYKNGMKGMDSLADILGKHSFNYIFATEMDEAAAKTYLKRNSIAYKNYKVMGDADNFMSGVLNEKPVFIKQTVVGVGKNHSGMVKSKAKGYYFIMDDKGSILYYEHKYLLPTQDTTFIRKLKCLPAIKSLNDI